MKVTIKDVAKAAGVSPSTVSRALHDNNRISHEVRQKVRQVAQELNFHPNQMARSLVDRKTRIVGIVFPGDAGQSLGHPFYPAVLQGLGHAASEEKYHLLLATGSQAVTSAEAGRNLAQSGYISGLVLLAAEDEPTEELGVPTVVVGRPLKSQSPFFVDTDNVKLGQEAVRYLTRRGHKRILFLGFDKQFVVTVDRLAGYKKALNEEGLPIRPEWIVSSRFNRNTTDNEHLRQIFRSKNRPTAAVCMDDTQAVSLTTLLGDLHLRVPEDVSLISINNTETGRYHNPPLTSFDVNPYELGVSAMNLMLSIIDGGAQQPASMEVPFTLVERQSVMTIAEKES